MFHYLFTNDLRISSLESVLKEAARCFRDDCVPSASEDKNANNNMNTLGFYFNLTKDSNCAKEGASGNVRKVVLNFIKKFQFPNPRTSTSLNDCVNDGICLAPMRVILKTLYIMTMVDKDQAYLTNKEILDYIFFSEEIAKNESPNIIALVKRIIDGRSGSGDEIIPDDETLESEGKYWKHCSRQIREMVKVLCWSGCVAETDGGAITIKDNSLTRDNKADIFEIITCTDLWAPDVGKSFEENKRSYQRYMDLPLVIKEEGKEMFNYHTGYKSEFALNRIVFGAPGTGKSYTVKHDAKKLLGPDNDADYERVTFHPDYSYANFVGTYKPVPAVDDEGKSIITYEYVPGPFMRIYVEAMKNCRETEPRPFLLIIEEINRANVAAVFGDIFQLLDRNDDNISEYPIQTSEDIRKYLAKELGGQPEDFTKIRIPDNMFIWATMNSADQGVFPMDTAFKRRWDFTYLGIDDSDEDIRGKYVEVGSVYKQRIEWNSLRKAINDFLAAEKINEDKQLGPYFIARSIVVPADGEDEINSDRFCDVFKHKVLMYLFDDAAKQKRNKLFEGCQKDKTRYSEICKAFDEQGIGIFNMTIQTQTEVKDLVTNTHELDENGMVRSEE